MLDTGFKGQDMELESYANMMETIGIFWVRRCYELIYILKDYFVENELLGDTLEAEKPLRKDGAWD